MGLPCVAGAETLKIDYAKRQMRAGTATVDEGDLISIDGTTGEIFEGELPTIEARFEDEHDLATLLGWADEVRRLQVWANADYPRDAERARAFGAQGIGLCRTEHMFFEEDRLPTVRRMILNAHAATAAKARPDDERSAEDREAIETFDAALGELERLQTDDFAGLFRAMDGLPVVIRLIDPPLHEFLPSHEELIAEVTRLRTILEVSGGGATDAVADRVTPTLEKGLTRVFGKKDAARAMKLPPARGQGLRDDQWREPGSVQRSRPSWPRRRSCSTPSRRCVEQNPMLGLRGVRLGLMVPDIVKMQTRAILAGAARVAAEGRTPLPEIMIPLVGHVNELRGTREILEAEVARIVEASGQQVTYKFGTMIEVPRGALTADEIAEHAEFFSFGTNDLTQMGFGYSRDDAEGKFLMQYVDRKILPENPFQVLDVAGIGQLIRMGVEKGRATKPDLKIGICGEHGGDPASIAFCHEVGLDYVSCSPFRVPVARLAAAQAAIASTESARQVASRLRRAGSVAVRGSGTPPAARWAWSTCRGRRRHRRRCHSSSIDEDEHPGRPGRRRSHSVVVRGVGEAGSGTGVGGGRGGGRRRRGGGGRGSVGLGAAVGRGVIVGGAGVADGGPPPMRRTRHRGAPASARRRRRLGSAWRSETALAVAARRLRMPRRTALAAEHALAGRRRWRPATSGSSGGRRSVPPATIPAHDDEERRRLPLPSRGTRPPATAIRHGGDPERRELGRFQIDRRQAHRRRRPRRRHPGQAEAWSATSRGRSSRAPRDQPGVERLVKVGHPIARRARHCTSDRDRATRAAGVASRVGPR